MKNFNQLVNSQLTRSIENYDKLSTFVYELMHLDNNKHNVWVVVKQQQLTLLTDNPYLGTQLQYQQQNICTEMNRRFLLELKTTKVKIVPPTASKQTSKQDLYSIGTQASEILAGIADEIEDKELKNSLLKLSQGNIKDK
jgi:hypothetical protein